MKYSLHNPLHPAVYQNQFLYQSPFYEIDKLNLQFAKFPAAPGANGQPPIPDTDVSNIRIPD